MTREQIGFKAAFAQDPDSLIACPACDTLHSLEPVSAGQTAYCTCCRFKLIAPKANTFDRTIALAVTSAILMIAVLSFPFLKMSKSGLSHEASVLDIIFGLAHGWYNLLAFAVAMFVVTLPMARAGALVYVLWALKHNRVPYRAKEVFLFAERLNPWAMSEIFIIGTGVALVKMAGLATISFGKAFWLYCLLVLIIGMKNAALCRWTVWSLIRKAQT